MYIRDIRLANLLALVRKHTDGNVSKFAELAGLESPTALLHVTAPQASRNLGPNLARQIELNLQLEAGWMDRDHTNQAATPGERGRAERALKFYESIEKLPPEARQAIDVIITAYAAGQKKAKRRKKKSDLTKR